MMKLRLLHRSWLASLALGAVLAGQARQAAPAPVALVRPAPSTVLFDQSGDGRLWALGSTYKASFGADGFVYLPFFGSPAPRNYPVQMLLRSVRIGGRDLTFAADARPTRDGTRVTFDRGAVREIYELGPDRVEQIFTIDGNLDGDVDVELEMVTDLAENEALPGVQLGNELGHVEYGTAYLVRGSGKTEIPAAFANRTLRLHVPAAQRGVGTIVIDPVIQTTSLTPTQMASELPEIAYDATTDRWLCTWVHVFSQSDRDVVAELRAANGDAVAGSYKVIDASTESHSSPHVANLASADRFLIVMERFRPADPVGRQYSLWGRTVDAPAPFATSGLFQISPSNNVNHSTADVGGDSGPGTKWMVVWVQGGNDIIGRQVDANATVSPATIPIETTATLSCTYPQISQSNGNGLTTTPRWLVAYHQVNAASSWDACAAVLDLNGAVTTPHRRLTNTGKDLYCNVASPLVDPTGQPLFLVSYERQESSSELVARVVDASLTTVVLEVNLTRRYGFSGSFSRVESDGIRFAAVCHVGGSLRVGTLAAVNNDLVLHEALQSISSSGTYPNLVSKRSGGGSPTDYGIIYISTGTPNRAALGLYQGRAPAGGFSRRSTSCSFSISYSGQPFVGHAVEFVLFPSSNELAGLLVGRPLPALTLCSTCRLGVDLSLPVLVLPPTAILPLPRDARLVGLTLAAQGFGLGAGSCTPNRLRLSDTVDFTIQ